MHARCSKIVATCRKRSLSSHTAVAPRLAQHNDGHADLPSYLNANSQGDNFAARFTWAPVRLRKQTFKLSAALTAFNGRSVYLNEPALAPSTHDRIRPLRFGASYDFSDSHGGRNLLKGEVSHGLNGLGASTGNTVKPSRPGGRTDFTTLQLDAQRMQDLGWTGAGAHVNVAKRTYLSPEVAFPLTRPVAATQLIGGNGYSPRFYLNFLKLF